MRESETRSFWVIASADSALGLDCEKKSWNLRAGLGMRSIGTETMEWRILEVIHDTLKLTRLLTGKTGDSRSNRRGKSY